MDRRRPRLDPERAAQISSRLALVLADRLPRRAAPREAGSAGPETDLEVAEEPILNGELPPPPFGRRHLTVVAVLLGVGLLVTGWVLLRARPVAVAGPAPVIGATVLTSASGSGSPPAPGSPTRPEPEPGRIVVHVLGAVRAPGLVRLPDRSRVQDAIAAAGGLKASADPGELNLAQVLSDGQQIMIGSRRSPAGEVRDGGSSGGDGGGSGGVSLDLNRATAAELEELPGVGPVTAERIVAWRTAHNRFNSVAELQEVDGIGPKTYAEIEPHVRV